MPHWDLSQLAPPLSGAMEFLRDHLPLSDLDTYPLSYFLSSSAHQGKRARTIHACRAQERK